MRGWRRLGPAILALAVTALLFTGCSHADAEKVAAKVVQDTVTALAAKDYTKARVNLTGEALEAVDTLVPVLQPMKAETKVSDFKVSSAKSDGQDTADVRAQWVQEQAVAGYGSIVQAYDVTFHLILLKGQWRIAYAHMLEKE